MSFETFVMLTKQALEIQPQLTYGFIQSWSCTEERRGEGLFILKN